MNITILNGNQDGKNKNFEQFLAKLCVYLEKEKHNVQHLKLRSMDIKYCTGCWGCWVKTPGQCVIEDDSANVCEAAINSDLLIFSSPIIMGFVSSVLKKTMDKMISLVHPYIDVVQGEFHHKKRYEKYPKLGLIMEKGPDTDDEDIAITTDIFQRLSINLRSSLDMVVQTDNPIEEVMNEINNL